MGDLGDLDLSGFRVDHASSTKKGKTEWAWVPIVSVFSGSILAYDQSLAAAGWVYVTCRAGIIIPEFTGVVSPDVIGKGHAETLAKADALFAMVRRLMEQLRPDLVAHEAPPIAGGRMSKMMRPESSLVAAATVRHAAAISGVPVRMIDGRTMKKRLTGNANAEKRDVGKVLVREFPKLTTIKPNNDNTRDAMAVAVGAAEEG